MNDDVRARPPTGGMGLMTPYGYRPNTVNAPASIRPATGSLPPGVYPFRLGSAGTAAASGFVRAHLETPGRLIPVPGQHMPSALVALVPPRIAPVAPRPQAALRPPSPNVGEKRSRDCYENAQVIAQESAELVKTIEMLWDDNERKAQTIATLQATVRQLKTDRGRVLRQNAALTLQLAAAVEADNAAPAQAHSSVVAACNLTEINQRLGTLERAARRL